MHTYTYSQVLQHVLSSYFISTFKVICSTFYNCESISKIIITTKTAQLWKPTTEWKLHVGENNSEDENCIYQLDSKDTSEKDLVHWMLPRQSWNISVHLPSSLQTSCTDPTLPCTAFSSSQNTSLFWGDCIRREGHNFTHEWIHCTKQRQISMSLLLLPASEIKLLQSNKVPKLSKIFK